MPCLEWSKLKSMQLGQYAEYYAKMEFTTYRYEVYTSEIDDHGVDFVVKAPDKPGQKSKPEWGINYSKKNKYLIEPYKIDHFFR